MYCEEVDNVISEYRDTLHALFVRFGTELKVSAAFSSCGVCTVRCSQQPLLTVAPCFVCPCTHVSSLEQLKNGKRAPRMSPSQWLHLFQLADLIDDDFTLREARLCFAWSRIRVSDPEADPVAAYTLSFTDFLEVCHAPPFQRLVAE